MYLQRVAAWQKLNARSVYNEIIVEGAGPASHWMAHLPDIIEGFFQLRNNDFSTTRRFHDRFLRAYGLDAKSHPLMSLDPKNWARPFTSHS